MIFMQMFPFLSLMRSLAGVSIRATLDNMVTMTLPSGTDSGKKFKLKGKGIPNKKTGIRGDEFAVIKIIVPKTINAKTKGSAATR